MPLTKAFKTELRKAVKDNANDGQCLRCGTFLGRKSHLFRNCPEKPINTFVRGRGNQPSPADRSEAEALYQEICEEFDPSWAPPTESDVKLPLNAAIEAKDTPKGRKNTNTTKNTGGKTAGAVKNQASTSTPPTLKSRTPVKDDKLGHLEPQSTVQKEEQEPQVGEDGILEVDTTFLGPPVNKAKEEFEIMSNYVQVKSIPKDLYVYSLKYWHPKPGFKPGTTIDQVVFNKRVEIMRAYKALHKLDRFLLTVNGCIWATDYKTLWSSSPLPQCSTALDAIWTTENAAFRDLKGENIDDMKATLTTKMPLRDLPKAFQENNVADLDDHIRALNAHVSRSVEQVTQGGNVPVTQIGVNKFYLNRGFKDMDRHGTLRGLRGYYTSIRSGRSGTLLNINTATSAFFAPITVAQMLRATPGPTTDKMSFVEKTLFGANLRVLYRRKNYDETPNLDLNSEEARSRTFKQFGKPAETQRFFTLLPADPRNPTAPRKCDPADTRGRTVEEYLQKECDINLRNICTDAYDWLCVNVGNIVKVSDDERERSAKRAQWIPACLLEIVQHQPVRGLLGPNHTKSMIDLAVHLPRRNAELITTEGFQSLGIYPGQNVTNGLQSLGLELDHKLVSLAAKTITAPAVTYRRPGNNASKVTKDIDPITASWNLQHVAFADTPPTDFRQIHVMGLKRCFGRTNIGNMSEQEALEALCTDFVSKLNEHSVQSSKGYCGTSQPLDVGPLKAWFKLCKPNDCTLVLLSDKDYDGYAKLKRTADCEEGQHTICAIGSKIKLSGPARHQHFSNLALKVNMKMGGANHFLHSGKLDMLLGRSRRSGTIILGADVTHPGHGTKEGSPSIACVVGSVDGEFMNYPGSMRLQAGKQEMIDNDHMRSMVKERLEAWKVKGCNKGQLPTNILFYRDGLSESQFASCERSEIKEIKEAYRELGGNVDNLKVTFIVVGKRHNTRFYPTAVKDTYKSTERRENSTVRITNGNLKPGLLVDNVITNLSPNNFFLQSHCAIKGTARSAHYHVLLDEMALYPGVLPELTLVLCYAFPRATKGVSYVAPAYIADRLCERGRAYLRSWHNTGEPFEKPVDDNGKTLNEQEMLHWKKQKAKYLARSPEVWGPQYNDGHDKNNNPRPGDQRLNPWHPSFDNGMFWM